MSKNLKKWLNWLLFTAVLIAVGWYIHKNFGELKNADLDLKIGFLVLSFISVTVAHLLNMAVWYRLAHSYGLKVGYLKTGKAWVVSRLGRYVPGKITLLLVRFNLYKGMSKKSVGMATLTEYLSSLAASCLITMIALLSLPEKLPSYFIIVVAIGIVTLAVVLHPKILQRFGNAVLKKFKKQPIEDFPPYRKIIGYICAYLIPILFHGLAFFFLLNALGEVPFKYLITITGVYYGSALIGMAAIFTPSGIGVREGIMMLVLPLIIAEPVVIVGAILIRLVTTAVELLLAGLFTLLEKISRNKKTV